MDRIDPAREGGYEDLVSREGLAQVAARRSGSNQDRSFRNFSCLSGLVKKGVGSFRWVPGRPFECQRSHQRLLPVSKIGAAFAKNPLTKVQLVAHIRF